MFSNLSSSKDLFTTNPSQVLGNRYDFPDSVLTSSQSNSQYLSSQMDSQLVAGSSQEFNQSPGRRHYQRYISKPSIFNKDSHASSSLGSGRNFQQHMQVSKAKAKERDDRDLLDSIVSTVKKCSSEVSDAVGAVRENIQDGLRSNDRTLKKYLEKIESHMTEQYSEILRALKEKDKEKECLQHLKEEVASKNAEIASLRSHVEVLESNQSHGMSELRDCCKGNQESLKNYCAKLDVLASEQSRYQQENVNLMEKYSKDQQRETVMFRETLRQLEQNIIHEFEATMGRLNGKMDSMNSYYEAQLRDTHKSVLRSVEEELGRKINRSTHCQLEQCRKRLEEVCERQERELRELIEKQVSDRCSQQRVQYREEIHTLNNMGKQELEQHLEKCLSQQENFQLNLQQQYENQLKELHRKQESEITRLKQQMSVSAGVNRWQNPVKPLPIVTRPSALSSSSNSGVFNTSRILISPGTQQWSSKILFSKSYTSPIAAVKPQVQHSTNRFTFSPVRLPITPSAPPPQTQPFVTDPSNKDSTHASSNGEPSTTGKTVRPNQIKGKRRKKNVLTCPKRTKYPRKAAAGCKTRSSQEQLMPTQNWQEKATETKGTTKQSSRTVSSAKCSDNKSGDAIEQIPDKMSVFEFQDESEMSQEVAVVKKGKWSSCSNVNVTQSSSDQNVENGSAAVPRSVRANLMRRTNSCSNISQTRNKLILKAHHSFTVSQDSSDDELGFFCDDSQGTKSQRSSVQSSPSTTLCRKTPSRPLRSRTEWI